jgi:hypothetical protein
MNGFKKIITSINKSGQIKESKSRKVHFYMFG